MCQSIGAVPEIDGPPHVLYVDDEPALRQVIAERLKERGFEVVEADSGEKAIDYLENFAFDILITDIRLPGIDGNQVVDAARERYPGIVVVVMTAFATIKDAVEATRRGVDDYLEKNLPFEALVHVLTKARERRQLQADNVRLAAVNADLRSQLEQRYQFGGIVGGSPPMRKLLQLLDTVAPASSTILITGETGTGKEVIARAIHYNGPRKANR